MPSSRSTAQLPFRRRSGRWPGAGDHEDLMRGGEQGSALVAGQARRAGCHDDRRPGQAQDAAEEGPAGGRDRRVRAWVGAGAASLTTTRRVARRQGARGSPGGRRPAEVSARLRTRRQELAVAGHKEVRASWTWPTGRSVRTLAGAADAVRTVAFSPDGKLIAAGGARPARGGEIVLLDAASGERTRTLEGHRDYVYAMAFSPNGRLLASGSYDKGVRLWTPAKSRKRARVTEHPKRCSRVAFSADGKLLASAAGDRTVKVWDAAEGGGSTRCRMPPTPCRARLRPERPSARRGRRRTRCCGSGTSATPRAARWPSPAMRPEEPIVALAFSPDGRQLPHAGADQRGQGVGRRHADASGGSSASRADWPRRWPSRPTGPASRSAASTARSACTTWRPAAARSVEPLDSAGAVAEERPMARGEQCASGARAGRARRAHRERAGADAAGRHRDGAADRYGRSAAHGDRGIDGSQPRGSRAGLFDDRGPGDHGAAGGPRTRRGGARSGGHGRAHRGPRAEGPRCPRRSR